MARLELSLLGGFHASVDGSPVTGFDTDKTRALLVYICVEASRPHTRETLAGLLWPELPEDAARRNLRNSLFKLRQALGEDEVAGTGDASPLLNVSAQTVQLNPDADYWLDLVEFTRLLADCRAHRHRKLDRCTTCHVRLQQAAALYQGDFLKGFHLGGCQEFEEWLLLRREALHREALDVLGRLSAYHEARAERHEALQYAYKQLELEPWREEVHRQVLSLLALTGQRSAALAQYETCRHVLMEEFNTEPSAETMALYEQIKADDVRWTMDDRAFPSSIVHHPSSVPNNLARPLTPFIGREKELARIIEHLDSPDYSLITILGPGGVGKTRLALQAAFEQVGAFDDGVYWVER